jgi:acyl-coenzyme A synthetase/AMP-(fatty) acid ligase
MFENLIPYWAATTPGAPAFVLPSGNISFRRFEDAIQGVSAALAAWGLSRGAKIVVSDTRPFMHWTALLALDRLGYVTISDDRSSSALAIPSIAGVIAETPELTGGHSASIVMHRDWFDSAMRLPRRPFPIGHDAADRVRILLSSGTTGRPKQCLLTRGVIDVRVTRRAAVRPHFHSLFTTAMGLGTTGGYTPPLGSWASGGAVAYGTISLTDTLVRLKPNHVLVSPQQLQQLLAELPADFARRDDLTVMIGGSATPAYLAAEARARLTLDVRLLYASTEGGSITSIDSAAPTTATGAVGYPNPWARLEIVGSDDRVLPAGETGIVRVAGDEVITQYDEAADLSALRNGWFYPGDVGSIRPDGMVVIAGRTDDVLNVGGVKISAFDLEQQILAVAGVREVAVLPIRDGRSERAVLAAIVIEPSASFDAIATQIRGGKYRISIAQISALPRNDMGKVMRRELEASLISTGALKGQPRTKRP